MPKAIFDFRVLWWWGGGGKFRSFYFYGLYLQNEILKTVLGIVMVSGSCIPNYPNSSSTQRETA